MPLHLLGKKSWNVYNPANIERVRRDEAAAQAREEEEERRLDEIDAQRRIAILRGEKPPSPPPELAEKGEANHSSHDGRGLVKRRRLHGEDDTDRDIRVAAEVAKRGQDMQQQLVKFSADKQEDAPLTDQAGHINLFPIDQRALKKAEKNAEREAEEAKKRRELEDQYTMRFSNAAGRNVAGQPWYTNSSNSKEPEEGENLELAEAAGKDVWGREDPMRKQREKTRITSKDPLAFMNKAQTQLKKAERDRKSWAAEREREMDAMKEVDEDERRRRKRRHSHRERRGRDKDEVDVDELEGFSLDAPGGDDSKSRHDRSREHRSRHHRSHRSRSHSRETRRHRSRRNRSREREPDKSHRAQSPNRRGGDDRHLSSARRRRSPEGDRVKKRHRE
ncbi:hypothetical protein IWX49DRAFT_560648 [Phyllosticta citricarpa]|uniref:CBF1-interacting co-repressor CIR N-terminal domain-containing protein n=1 Tax=Phyllosticta citricarpa TaxID=55181 RepID=A0ABR1MKU0_9PEZI